MKCSRAWNVREFREIARFAKFSCTRIFAPCSQLPVSFWIFQIGPLLREIWAKTYSNIMKSGLILLKMVRFSIRNHRWKAEDLSYLKICENFMHANCLWPKFAKFSCREFFMFYSNSLIIRLMYAKQRCVHSLPVLYPKMARRKFLQRFLIYMYLRDLFKNYLHFCVTYWPTLTGCDST